MERIIVAIGGGEIKNKTTLKIDEYVATLIKKHAAEKRGYALFLGTASHDSMPYYNSFRKTYTSVFDIKADVGLIVYGEMDLEKIKAKINLADCIYIGGGNTIYMLEKWKESGLYDLILQAYKDGKIICGLSAGAICWFTKMFTDSYSTEYALEDGIGVINGTICPHFNERKEEFINAIKKAGIKTAYGVENDCAVVFKNETFDSIVSSGGKAYIIKNEDNITIEEIK